MEGNLTRAAALKVGTLHQLHVRATTLVGDVTADVAGHADGGRRKPLKLTSTVLSSTAMMVFVLATRARMGSRIFFIFTLCCFVGNNYEKGISFLKERDRGLPCPTPLCIA